MWVRALALVCQIFIGIWFLSGSHQVGPCADVGRGHQGPLDQSLQQAFRQGASVCRRARVQPSARPAAHMLVSVFDSNCEKTQNIAHLLLFFVRSSDETLQSESCADIAKEHVGNEISLVAQEWVNHVFSRFDWN